MAGGTVLTPSTISHYYFIPRPLFGHLRYSKSLFIYLESRLEHTHSENPASERLSDIVLSSVVCDDPQEDVEWLKHACAKTQQEEIKIRTKRTINLRREICLSGEGFSVLTTFPQFLKIPGLVCVI